MEGIIQKEELSLGWFDLAGNLQKVGRFITDFGPAVFKHIVLYGVL